MLGMELVAGSGVFLVFVIGYAIALVYAQYGRRTGIASRPYAKRYGGAPGADGALRAQGRDRAVRMYTRGTR